MKYKQYFEDKLSDYQQIDIIISRDCTLRCTYCYLHKYSDDKYDYDKIFESLDRLLDYYHNDSIAKKNGVILSLYPEPWVDVNKTEIVIKKILLLLTKYPRFMEKYMFMLGTNGVKLDEPIPILDRLLNNLSINVTIDGIKEQHDMYRVFPDNSPSWDLVVNNVKKYQDKYNIYTTKVTYGPDTIKYMYDSTIYLWNELNLKDINMNVVFENLWGTPEDKIKTLIEFENQIEKIYNYIIEYKCWENEKYVSIISSRNIPGVYSNPFDVNFHAGSYCGAAVMRSIDVDGEIYPCFRLSPYSLDKPSPFKITQSLNDNSVRALNCFNVYDSAPNECLKCPLLSICPMCVGGPLQEKDTIFWRTTHHCEFVKIQYKWALKLENYIRKLDGEGEIPYAL